MWKPIIKAFTILELLTIIIIIGILVTLALPYFSGMREKALDREAKANLKLIQAAEKIYRMEIGIFWPPSGWRSTSNLNTNLKLDVSSKNWAYQATSSGGDTPLTVQASRVNPPAGWNRTWQINETAEEATCSGSGCP